jgi:plasmid stability protein
MSKMIQLRNVPDELHGLLKSRAALAGMSLSDYLLHEIRRFAERPTREELIKRLEALPSIKTSQTPAEMIRELRGRR